MDKGTERLFFEEIQNVLQKAALSGINPRVVLTWAYEAVEDWREMVFPEPDYFEQEGKRNEI